MSSEIDAMVDTTATPATPTKTVGIWIRVSTEDQV